MTLKNGMAIVLAGAGICSIAVAEDAGTASRQDVALQNFRSRTEAVRVDVAVMNDGRLVSGLAIRDFEVRDQGVTQRLALIEVEQLPLDLICAFDSSASVTGPLLQDLTIAGEGLLANLHKSDRISFLTFSSALRLIAPLGSDSSAVVAALSKTRGEGRTRLRDGVFAALALREDNTRRTLLLLFTDGKDTGSWLSGRALLEAASRTDVVVYSVLVRKPRRDEGFVQFLSELADVSGGRVIVANAPGALANTFKSTLDEFRVRYVLSYIPTGVPSAGWHQLDVRVKGKRGTVIARRGYFSE